MQRFLFVFLFLIIGFFGALLITPSFINWNEYRDDIINNIYSKTGLNFEIRGNIKLEMLPSPALLIKKIHLANIEGAATADTLKIDMLEVSVALIPLLGRQLKIKTIKLINPILNIEILPDGRNNMASTIPNLANTHRSKLEKISVLNQGTRALDTVFDDFKIGLFSFSIEDFFIQNGFISYNNHIKSHTEKIGKLDARLSLASPSGPLESSGNGIIRGIPINYSLSTGTILKNRTLPINLNLNSFSGESDLRFFGALTQIDKDPKIKGKINFSTKNLVKLTGTFDKVANLSSGGDRRLAITTSVEASMKRGTFPDINFNLDNTQGTGKIAFENNKKTNLNVSFVFNKIDIDAFIKNPRHIVKKTKTVVSNKQLGPLTKSKNPSVTDNANFLFNDPETRLSLLPKNINVMFDLSSAAIIYNKAVVRQVKINANLEDQEITISQASALLPGSTDLGLQGIIFAKPETKIPQFEGTTDFTTNNLRTLLNWLGVKPPEVPYNRLRRLTVSGKIFANMKKLAFKNIKGKIDDTKITGRISTTINERPLLNINLAANHLNLDGYFLSHKTEGSGSKTTIIKNEGVGSVPSKSLKSKNINSEGKFAELSKVGVNLRISLGKLIVGNLPIKKTILTGKLENSKLIISNLEFDDLAGISAKVGGEILNIDETNNRIPPKFKDFSFNFYTKDLNRALDFLEIKKLAIEKKIGKASLSGKLTGDYEKMGIKADLSLLGGRWGYNGLVESLIGNPSFKAKVSMSHPSLSNLLLKLDNNYQLKNKRSDPINITSNITGSLKKIKFSDLLGKVRDIKISGNIIADLKEPIPVMDVDLKTGNIIFDDFLPIQYQTLFDKHITKYENYVSEIISNKPKIIRASYSTSPKTIKTRLIAGKLGQRKSKSGLPWRKNAIDISVIKKFGGDIKLQAESLQFKKHRINSINTSITVNDNVMSIKHLTGNAYDGTIELDGQLLAAKAVDKFKTRFKVVNVNTAKLLDTIGTRGFRRGALDITGEFNSSGRLTLDHINTLNGMGVISVRGLEFLSGNKKNTTMSGFGGLFLSIDKFSNTILGNNIVSKRTNFNTSFIADNGVVRFEDMSLKTGLGSGTAKGLIDLPKWKIVTSGEIKLSQNILSQILVKQPSKPIYLPFSIKGRLDNPSMKLKTSEITKIGIRLPNIFENKIDRISKKKGIDNLLEKVLPKVKIMNKRIGESEVDSKHPDKRQSPLNNKIKTHDFLKNILRELTN